MHISLDSVSVSFGDHTVLRDISLEFSEHRIGLVGANGSGKSTLARLLNGLVLPSTGSVTVDGMTTRNNSAQIRRRVGFIFTNPDSQIVMPTVGEDIAFSLRHAGVARAEQQQRVVEIATRFGLHERLDQAAHSLSGGQKQLLALASILAIEPELLVADEPTTLLDARNTRRMMDVFASLPQQLIVATHQLDTLAAFDRVIVLDAGLVVADDTPAAALAHYRNLVEQ